MTGGEIASVTRGYKSFLVTPGSRGDARHPIVRISYIVQFALSLRRGNKRFVPGLNAMRGDVKFKREWGDRRSSAVTIEGGSSLRRMYNK